MEQSKQALNGAQVSNRKWREGDGVRMDNGEIVKEAITGEGGKINRAFLPMFRGKRHYTVFVCEMC